MKVISILDSSTNFGKYFGKLVKFWSKFWSKLWEKGVIMNVFLGSSTLFLCILSLKIATAQKLCNFLVTKSGLIIWGSASIVLGWWYKSLEMMELEIWELDLEWERSEQQKLEKYMNNLSDGVRMKDIWSEIENFEGPEFTFGLSLGFGLESS